MADLVNDLIGDTDAMHWAQRFVVVHHNVLTGPERSDIGDDEGAMLAWFASAIEAGRMGAGRMTTMPPPPRFSLVPSFRCPKCGEGWWTRKGYRGHYALRHILEMA